jgi:hypothetical protein
VDVWGITLATLRRWYVLLPVLALSVLMALAAGHSASPEYEATGTALLTPARSTAPIANPFVNAEGANNALVIILNGPETRAKLDKRGVDATVTVVATSRTPIFTVRSDASSEPGAIAAVDAVIEIASDELKTRQLSAGVKPEFLIGLQTLAKPSITAIDNNTAIRVQAVILVLGTVLGIVLAVFFDDMVGLLRRRRARRRAARATADASPADAKPDAEPVDGQSDAPADGSGTDSTPGQADTGRVPAVRDAGGRRSRSKRRGRATAGTTDPDRGLEELSTASTGSDT